MENSEREAFRNNKRLERFYELRSLLDYLPHERKEWDNMCHYHTGLQIDNCSSAGCIGGWASVLFKAKLDEIESMFEQIFEVTYEEAQFICYGNKWQEYNEIEAIDLTDFSEAMRRFNKLIAHYEFLEGKHPKPEQYIE